MSDDYLWEKSGPPDPEVEALERALGGLRYDGEAPALPRRRRMPGWGLLTAAALAACVLIAIPLVIDMRAPPQPEGWAYVDGAGRARVLAVGRWIETGADERAQLTVADIGSLELAPGSRLQLVRTDAEQHRMHLEHGALHAKVDAPPRLFIVETPSADAVDLGCEYTLLMEPNGQGKLAVFTGRVALERDGRAVEVPYDAECSIDRARGPGTPYFPDADPAFLQALAAFDRTGSPASARTLAKRARARDTLTLWHLLPQVKGRTREAVYDAMARHAATPAGVTKALTLALDEVALDEWWQELYWSAFYGDD